MKDYLRIKNKIQTTPWFITSEGLDLILSIFDRRLNGNGVSDEELATLLEAAGTHGSDQNGAAVNGKIGVLPIYGPIFGKANMMTELSGATSLETFRKDFSAMMADGSIESIVLDIDSPGGTSEMVPETGAEIFAARGVKPVYSIANSMSGSAALWLASQADKFYSTPSGSVGSIGAYTVHEDQSARDAQQGRRFTYVSAGPYKTEGNPHQPLSQEAINYRQEIIDELYGEFVNAVGTGRGVSSDFVKENFGGGRMMTPKKALEAGLIDGVMEYDALVADLSSQPARSVQISINGSAIARAMFDPTTGHYQLESKEWEHSEPGTGSPPAPRLPERVEPDVASGSRRPDITRGIPNEHLEPGAPKANANGGIMDEAQLNALMQLFGVDSEEALIEAVTSLHQADVALRGAITSNNRERQFQEQFPEQYASHLELLNKDRKREAVAFASKVSTFTRPEGDKMVKTEMGLSALATNTLEELYMKFASGTGSLADFESAVTCITQGGVVNYGEAGSSREPENMLIDTTNAAGVQNVRQQFATLVASIQSSDKLEYQDAIAEAAKRNPDLAAAYRSTASA